MNTWSWNFKFYNMVDYEHVFRFCKISWYVNN